MPTEVLIDAGTQIRFSVNGSLSPVDAATNLTIGTPTDVDMTMSGVADDAARQSDKADLGANWARRYAVLASQDFTGETPVINTSCDYYWAPSTSATTANAASANATSARVSSSSHVDDVGRNGTSRATAGSNHVTSRGAHRSSRSKRL